MALVNSIYRVKCKKKESNTYSKMENKSSEAAAMTVLLGRDFIGNARNLSLIVRVLIAYLFTFLSCKFCLTSYYDCRVLT